MRRHSLTIALAVTLLTLGIAAGFVVSDSAFAQGETPSQTTTGETTTGSEAEEGESLGDVFWKIFFLSVLVALVWSVPLIIDIVMAYDMNRKRLRALAESHKELINKTKDDKLSPEQIAALSGAADLTYQPSQGMRGLTRSLFAFAVLATISTVLFALIALGRSEDEELVEGIIAALVGAFSAIVGVYFGSRTAESATETQTANLKHIGQTQLASTADQTTTGDESGRAGN